MRRRRLAPLLAALLLGGCAETMHSVYSEPYVQFEAEHNLQLSGLFPATITAIDGRAVNAGATPPVPPGPHTLQVEMRLQHDAATAVPRTLDVDAKPCTRYYIASKKGATGAFEPVVATTEPIKECEKLPKARAAGM